MAVAVATQTDPWPGLRRYILGVPEKDPNGKIRYRGGRGGLGAGDWSPDLIPGGLYRRHGAAPDLVAAEAPHECAAAMGLWDPDDGSEAMLEALTLAYDAHRRQLAERGAARVETSRTLPRGERRLSDHIDRLAAKWGERLDLEAIGAAGEEIVRLYESGERVALEVGGEVRRATVGCTGTPRPEFVYLLSLPVLEVEAN